jgi:hypothetical protein
MDKHSNSFGLVISDKEERAITLVPGVNFIKLFSSSLITRLNKVEHLSLVRRRRKKSFIISTVGG